MTNIINNILLHNITGQYIKPISTIIVNILVEIIVNIITCQYFKRMVSIYYCINSHATLNA